MSYYGEVNADLIDRESQATMRHPTWSCLIGLVGDVTDDILKIDVSTEIEDGLREPNYGRGAVVLDNQRGQYLEGEQSIIEEDALVRVFAGFSGENVPVWTGVVTDAQPSAKSGTITLSVAEMGERLAQTSTYGDFSSYDSPKLLIEYLCDAGRIPAPVIQDSADYPTTFTFGYTDVVNRRTFWSLIHGAVICINSIPYFDPNGVLNVVHRATVNDVDFVIGDDMINDLTYVEDVELINQRTINFDTSIKWSDPQFGDKIHPWQMSVTRSNLYSQARWGVKTDAETDPLIGNYKNAKAIADEDLDWFPYLRSKFRLIMRGMPQLALFDRFYLDSKLYGIAGFFTIIGRTHRISRASYITEDLIIGHGERL